MSREQPRTPTGRLLRPTPSRRGWRSAAVAVALAGVLPMAGCGGEPRASESTSSSAAVPAGGQRVRTGQLALTLPPGLSASANNLDGAETTYRGTPPPGGGPDPLVAFFVERGAVGPLELRTQLLAKVRSAQVKTEPSGPARTITVPGAIGANVIEWRWTYPASGSIPSGSVRLVEILVQTSGPAQYGVKFVGPAPLLTDDAVNSLLASLRVDATAPSAPPAPSGPA